MRRLAIFGLFAGLTILHTYPLSLNPGGVVVPGDADTELFMWTLAWNTHALLTDPTSLFAANIYYPLRNTLAFSENLLGATPFAAPVLLATGNHVLALNAVALASVLLSGVGAFLLARRLGLGTAAAVLCGIVFAFSPARFYRYGQLHLTTVHWIPFALAYLHAYFDEGRRRHLWLAVMFFTLQVLTTGHGAIYAALAIGAVIVYQALRSRRVASAVQVARDFGWQGILLAAPSILLFLPYRAVQEEAGLRRTLADWSATPESLLASPSHVHTFVNTWLAGRDVNATATAFMFPGWLPILFGAAALLFAWRTHARALMIYGAVALLSLLLAVGEPFSLWPYVYWMPGLNFIRVPSRFIILTTLALAVLSAVGFDWLLRRTSTRTRAAVAATLAIALMGEFSVAPFTGTTYAVQIPSVDRWLDRLPKPFVVAEIPVGTAERWHSSYMLHATAHWQPTVHGHSGTRLPLHDELFGQLREFPDEEGVANLQRLGVNYLVVHTDAYEDGEWPEVERRLRAFEDVLVLEAAVGKGRVYRVRPPELLAGRPGIGAPGTTAQRTPGGVQ